MDCGLSDHGKDSHLHEQNLEFQNIGRGVVTQFKNPNAIKHIKQCKESGKGSMVQEEEEKNVAFK
jgi:hypothetical protein